MANTKPSSKKVLVAIRPEDLSVVSAALGSEFDVVVAHSLEDAKAQLGKQVGLIACGVHFDNGTMFDLLHAAKADPKTRAIPFFLLTGEAASFSKPIMTGIRTAAKLLGAAGFTDLAKLKADVGEQQAYERLRQVVREALSNSGQD